MRRTAAPKPGIRNWEGVFQGRERRWLRCWEVAAEGRHQDRGSSRSLSLDEGASHRGVEAREPAWRSKEEPSQGLEWKVPEKWDASVIHRNRRGGPQGWKGWSWTTPGRGKQMCAREAGIASVPCRRTWSRRGEKVRGSLGLARREVRMPVAGGPGHEV